MFPQTTKNPTHRLGQPFDEIWDDYAVPSALEYSGKLGRPFGSFQYQAAMLQDGPFSPALSAPQHFVPDQHDVEVVHSREAQVLFSVNGRARPAQCGREAEAGQDVDD